MKLQDLANQVPLLNSALPQLEISGLTEDSRAVQKGFLFAALPGVKADGSVYAAQAAARGAVAVLAGPSALNDVAGVTILRTENPRRALALMAANFYGAQPKTIMAVTGTNGKTSVTAFIRQIWNYTGKKAASLGTIGIIAPSASLSLARTTPDPVTLHRQLRDLAGAGITHLAMEASSHGLAQHRLDGVKLSAGAFTNLTRDHLDYHGSFEGYLAAKMRLFEELLSKDQPAVIDTDETMAETVAELAAARGLKVSTVGRKGALICLKGLQREGFKQRLTLGHAGKDYEVLLPLAGDFQVSNALIAAGLALALGEKPTEVFQALERLQGAHGRLELVGETCQRAPVFIDYAHTPDALIKALQALRPYASGKLHVVFGCGGDRDKGKRPLMGQAAAEYADRVIVTDDNPRNEDAAQIRREVLAGAPGAVEIADRARAIGEAIRALKPGDVLLVAGKGHETGQIIGAQVVPFSDREAVLTALAAGAAKKS